MEALTLGMVGMVPGQYQDSIKHVPCVYHIITLENLLYLCLSCEVFQGFNELTTKQTIKTGRTCRISKKGRQEGLTVWFSPALVTLNKPPFCPATMNLKLLKLHLVELDWPELTMNCLKATRFTSMLKSSSITGNTQITLPTATAYRQVNSASGSETRISLIVEHIGKVFSHSSCCAIQIPASTTFCSMSTRQHFAVAEFYIISHEMNLIYGAIISSFSARFSLLFAFPSRKQSFRS